MQVANQKVPSSLIATLGAEPQVVTLALEVLAREDERLEEVIVVHSAPVASQIRAALDDLDQAFATHRWLGEWRGRYRKVEIQANGRPVPDMLTPADFNAVLDCLYRLVRDKKQMGFRIHLNLAGGRKLMAIAAMTVAQLLFDDDDCLWYLQSSSALVASRRLFADSVAEINLIQVPLLRWSQTPPILTDVALMQDPVAALTRQHEQMSKRKVQFLKHDLTRAEREVAELLIRTGASDAELADMLSKSRHTVSRQLESIYSKLRLFLGVRDDVRVDRTTLIVEFRPIVRPEK